MSKINISFNNTNYSIDESALSAASNALKSHLSTVMNGTGATINLGGVPYSIDSTKLSAATNDFTTYLGTISGTGYKVNVGGVEYGVGADKVSGAFTSLNVMLGDLSSGSSDFISKTIIFDGNADGKDNFKLDSGDYYYKYVKISEALPTAEELNTCTFTIKIADISTGKTKERIYTPDGETTGAYPVLPNATLIVGPDGVDFMIFYNSGDFDIMGEVFTVPSSGVYVLGSYEGIFSGVLDDTIYAEIKFLDDISI